MPEIAKLKCKRCSHEWIPTKEKPSCCPRCKSYDWDKDPEKKQETSK
jgi:predicted Zn-ribbon and HTH transcriptional regulator